MKNFTWKTWLVLVAAILAMAYCCIYCEDEDANTNISIATSVAVTSVIQDSPEAVAYFQKAADIIDAAVIANDGDTTVLAEQLCGLIGEDNNVSRVAITCVLRKLNSIDTDLDKEQIIGRLKAISEGIRAAIYEN